MEFCRAIYFGHKFMLRKILLFVFGIYALFLSCLAQSPQSFKYQTILRNLSGQPIANRAVRFQVGIQRGMNGPTVYQEQHSDTTNAQGLAILEVGRGTLINNSPAFSSIRWDSATHFLALDFDSIGNGNFLSMGSFELLSVPYALYAQSSGNSTPGPQGPQGIPGPQGPPGNGLSNGTAIGQILYWNGSTWATLNPVNNYPRLILCDSLPTWTSNGHCPGKIGNLSCSNINNTGALSLGLPANGVVSTIPYTSGNGGFYNPQTINSTGVVGLIASLDAGFLVTGSGNLSFTITGTPASTGIASFQISIGGRSCTLNRVVDNQTTLWRPGTIACSLPTQVVSILNPLTNKIWMDRNLGASRAALSMTDAQSYGDLYQWGRFADGHQCRNSGTYSGISSTDAPGHSNFIISSTPPSFGWLNTQNNNLWQGVNGINNPCPNRFRVPTDAELDAERLSWTNNPTPGPFASPLKLTLGGHRNTATTNLVDVHGYYWSSTVSGLYQSNYLTYHTGIDPGWRGGGMSIRCIQDTSLSVPIDPGIITTLSCSLASSNGLLSPGTSTSGVSSSIPYTGGNGGAYLSRSVNSTGVTGLTATLAAGNFAVGNDSLIFNITGIPSATGIASFNIQIGGQSCSLDRLVSGQLIHCGNPTLIVPVTNPTTNKTWMDRNLGASRVAISPTDSIAYGNLYQWGRFGDGHQCRNSDTTTTLSSTDTPGHGRFIIVTDENYDWRRPQINNLWQGASGLNSPCPNGYRLPTESELDAERLSWSINSANGAFLSPLKLSLGGCRFGSNSMIGSLNFYGNYWTSTISGAYARQLKFYGENAYMDSNFRSVGCSIRCIQD